MNAKILLPFFVFLILSLASSGQQVSQMNKFYYNNTWNIKKGDSIHLGKASDVTFKHIFQSASDRKDKGFLPKTSAGKAYKIEAIKKFIWSNEDENIYIIIEEGGDKYFVDLYDAVQYDEVVLPVGIRKMTLVGDESDVLPMKNGSVIFEKVIEVKDKTKGQIYAALRKWFAESFKDSKSVIQVADKEEGLITGKGNYSFFLKETIMMTHIYGTCDFTINIDIKDGKFKYQVYGFTLERDTKSILPVLKVQLDPVRKSSEITQSFEEIAKALALDNNVKYCKSQIRKLNSVISGIDFSIREAATAATDDW